MFYVSYSTFRRALKPKVRLIQRLILVLQQHSRAMEDEATLDLCSLEAVKLLMVLRALEALDSTVTTRVPARPFYADLFVRHNPKELMDRLQRGIFEEVCSTFAMARF